MTNNNYLYSEGHNVDSSALLWIGWDEQTNHLYVTFHDGSTWRYSGIDAEEWHDFNKAESLGSYFARYIKGIFEAEQMDKAPTKRDEPEATSGTVVTGIQTGSPIHAIETYVNARRRWAVTLLVEADNPIEALEHFKDQRVTRIQEVIDFAS